jgi:hypothetical protein
VVAKAIVGVEAGKIDQRCTLARDERGNAVIEEVFQARPPAVGLQVLESGDDAGGGERATLGRDPSRGIEADGIFGLAGTEVAHVVDARARMASRMSSARSPCGSMTATRSPAKISDMARLKGTLPRAGLAGDPLPRRAALSADPGSS